MYIEALVKDFIKKPLKGRPIYFFFEISDTIYSEQPFTITYLGYTFTKRIANEATYVTIEKRYPSSKLDQYAMYRAILYSLYRICENKYAQTKISEEAIFNTLNQTISCIKGAPSLSFLDQTKSYAFCTEALLKRSYEK